ncbi:prephenate dehydratase domain-containing protein [Mesorhizobium sp. M0145]|uniref:prephenate dehydratase domain-containing protein n=1 Tax=Mesorhizobium sp. M0145 TaxID=2956895 RepID=UPI00333A3DCD
MGTTPYVDGLLALRSLFVVAEYPKILSYSLIAPSTTTVMGHPVALEEVTDWLDENMPHVSREARAGTIHHVASLNSPAVASIGPGLGAKLCNLHELRTGIEEGLHNVTRWWVLGWEIPACTGYDRTTLHLRTREQEFGSFMRDLAQSGIEILNIYERPTFQGLDDHHYLIDVSGHASDEKMRSFVNGRRHLRILGSYPRASGSKSGGVGEVRNPQRLRRRGYDFDGELDRMIMVLDHCRALHWLRSLAPASARRTARPMLRPPGRCMT